jgi:hypothetical protein
MSADIPMPDGNILQAEEVLATLQDGALGEEHGRLRWSSNFTFLISVCKDDLTLKTIYKPQRGERPLWDFPDGTLCYREAASYVVSRALGWNLVPPTVLRNGSRGLGSVQMYIEHNPEITYFNLDETFIPQLQRFALFDYITNNADRKGGHLLLGANDKLWGIDHGICFHVVPKLRTVVWNFSNEAVPTDLLPDIDRVMSEACNTSTPLHEELTHLLAVNEVDAMTKRMQHLLTTQKFPRPGHGPSYPWPPV